MSGDLRLTNQYFNDVSQEMGIARYPPANTRSFVLNVSPSLGSSFSLIHSTYNTKKMGCDQ